MNCANDRASPSGWKNVESGTPAAARLYPVPTASTKTRSVNVSHVYGLSLQRVDGVGGTPWSSNGTRLGPSAPRCSSTDAAPGPPLQANAIGRLEGSAASCLT